jgi:hypothetical protein
MMWTDVVVFVAWTKENSTEGHNNHGSVVVNECRIGTSVILQYATNRKVDDCQFKGSNSYSSIHQHSLLVRNGNNRS